MDSKFEKLLTKAFKLKTTDIHFLFSDEIMKISFRCLSGLKEIKSDEDDIKLFNYLQYLAHIDISCTSIPQSGSFEYIYKNIKYNFRFAVQQTLHQKSGVLRILNYQYGLPIEQLTYQKDIIKKLNEIVHMRTGLIIFSGLTGSGKTTTMYSLINMMKNRKVYTIEDPIEIVQSNVIQTEINNKIGYTYNEGIKQLLRQNPDVIMIGEIRDELALKGAIRAALTGCLVLCSIHSKSVTGTINRMLDLQANKFDLIECVSYIFSQRLVKKFGKEEYTCVFEYIDTDIVNDVINGNKIYKSKLDEIVRKGVENESIEDIN